MWGLTWGQMMMSVHCGPASSWTAVAAACGRAEQCSAGYGFEGRVVTGKSRAQGLSQHLQCCGGRDSIIACNEASVLRGLGSGDQVIAGNEAAQSSPPPPLPPPT